MSYEWMKSGMEDVAATPFQAVDQKPATKEQLFGFFEQIEEALDARNYFHPPTKVPKMIDNLRAVLSRPGFTEPEISVLRGRDHIARPVCASLEKGRGAGETDRQGHGDGADEE